MSFENREKELRELLQRECVDPKKINVMNIIKMVMEEVAATQKDT